MGTLSSVLDQKAEGNRYEVIVVDNNSTDGTQSVIMNSSHARGIRYVMESAAGLAHARNRGLNEARGEFIAYIDDDVILPNSWVEELFGIIRNNPGLSGAGGPLYPFYTTAKPAWFKDEYGFQMARASDFILERGQAFIGANMVWRKDILMAINGFNTDLGMKGSDLGLGEETEAYLKAWETVPDAKFYYSVRLAIKHWMPGNKMSVSYRLRRTFGAGLVTAQLERRTAVAPTARSRLKDLLVLVKLVGRTCWRLRLHRRWQNWAYEDWTSISFKLGEIASSFSSKSQFGSR